MLVPRTSPFAVQRVASTAAWLLCAPIGCTFLGAASHLGSSALTTTVAKAATRQGGILTIALLVAVLVALAVLGWLLPVLRGAARRVSLLGGGIALSGMPWTFLCAMVAPRLGLMDFWGLAQLGSLLALVLWLRMLTESWRALPLLWQPATAAAPPPD